MLTLPKTNLSSEHWLPRHTDAERGALGLRGALQSQGPPSSRLQWPPRDLALEACPPGQEAWDTGVPLAQWHSLTAFLIPRKPGIGHLMGYLGQISMLRLVVLLPACFWGFLCSREL